MNAIVSAWAKLENFYMFKTSKSIKLEKLSNGYILRYLILK